MGKTFKDKDKGEKRHGIFEAMRKRHPRKQVMTNRNEKRQKNPNKNWEDEDDESIEESEK